MIPEYGIFALDPGLTSAYAWGVVRDEGPVADRLGLKTRSGSATIKDVDWLSQAMVISRDWTTFAEDCRARHTPAYLVCEDFILTRFKSSDRSGLYPVWVAAALSGHLAGLSGTEQRIIWQQPSAAKGYATDARLRDWGIWIVGKEHERDAWRHFAHFVANSTSQKMRQAHAHTHSTRGNR